jgi:hypothetical protein
MRRVLLIGMLVLATLVPAPAGTAAGADRPQRVDFTGDDLDDLAIGAPGEDLGVSADAGAVNVQYGSAAGPAGSGQVLTQATPEDGDRFGAALAKGRFNDDDFVDLAVGAPAEDIGRTDAAGAVTVFYGSAAGLAGPGDLLQQGNPESGDAFGATLDSADFNGDGVDDLAVGAPGETVALARAAGAVSVFYAGGAGLAGPGPTLLQDNPEAGDLFGAALVSGSFRHNGSFDLAVGAPGEDIGARLDIGAVGVFLGQAGGITPGGPRTVTQREVGGAEETGDQFGFSLAAGLYNGDDFYDLAIGVPGEDIGTVTDAGAVNTMHGSAGGLAGTGGALFQGDNALGDVVEPNDRFGQSLAKGIFFNNFNGDVFDDLAVGVAQEDVGDRPDAGLVNLLEGSSFGLQGSNTVLFQGADLGGGARVGGSAEAGDALGATVE